MRTRRVLVAAGLVLGQLLVISPPSSAAVTCRFDAERARVHVMAPEPDTEVIIQREAGGDGIEVDAQLCHGATVHNVDRIAVTGGPGYQGLIVNLGSGWLGPGATRERTRISEIEISFEGRLGFDHVYILGGTGADRIGIGRAGAAIGRDSDTDFRWWGVEGGWVDGWSGADRLRSTSSREVPLYGGRGEDVLIGAGGNDYLSGGYGDDVIAGYDGRDQIVGGDGADRVRAGDGDDRLFLYDGEQELSIDCGAGQDVIRRADPEDVAAIEGQRCEAVPV